MIGKPTYKKLEQRVKKLEKEVAKGKYAEKNISKLSKIFDHLGVDPRENIDIIVRQTCEILKGICSLYNRLDDKEKSLYAWSAHNLPPDFNRKVAPYGHICYEATIKGKDKPVALGDLEGTTYEKTDLNVKKYSLKSYLGFPVSIGSKVIGSLCIVDVKKRTFSPIEIYIISTLAKAVSIEENRKRTEEDLRKAHDKLEMKVGERTAELVMSKEKLEKEIEERKQAEKALREGKERYRNLFGNTGTATFVIEEDMTVAQANTKCEDLLGYSRDEIVGKMKLTDFVHVVELERVKTSHFERRKKNNDIPTRYELKLIDKNENVKNVIIQVGLIPNTEQSIASIIDVTPLKKAENTLRESEERFRNLTETTSDWIWEIDKNECYTYVSPKIYDMLGYDPEEIIGKTPFDLMPSDESDRVSKIFNKIAKSKQPFSCLENINIHKDGHPVVFETSGIPIFDSNGKFSGYRGIDRDITERKRIEMELRKAHDELEHRVKERTSELEIKTSRLEELNTAMGVLLKKREEDKEELEDNVLANVKDLIEPYLKKIKNTKMDDHQKVLLSIIESNLRELTSPFASKLTSKYINLTPSEIQVADFVKHGKRNKEIATLLNLSIKTIESHRESIRKKIGIKNTKTNLRSYLLTLQ